jgi:hypothetical protein
MYKDMQKAYLGMCMMTPMLPWNGLPDDWGIPLHNVWYHCKAWNS